MCHHPCLCCRRRPFWRSSPSSHYTAQTWKVVVVVVLNRAAAKHTPTRTGCTTAIRVSVLRCGAQQWHDKHTQTTREYSRGERRPISTKSRATKSVCYAGLSPLFLFVISTQQKRIVYYIREEAHHLWWYPYSSIRTVFIDISKAAGPAQHPSSLCAMERHCDFL